MNSLYIYLKQFFNKDFRELKLDKLSSESMVYCDPPYLVSCGVYQDGKRGFKGWNQQDDLDLMELLDNCNSNGIKFAMSETEIFMRLPLLTPKISKASVDITLVSVAKFISST